MPEDRKSVREAVLHAVYREKIYADSLEMRRSLVRALMDRCRSSRSGSGGCRRAGCCLPTMPGGLLFGRGLPGTVPAPAGPVGSGFRQREAADFHVPGGPGVVAQVQAGLHSWGYYEGPIDGVVEPGTNTALRGLQTDWRLKGTGTITPEVLDTLGILAR